MSLEPHYSFHLCDYPHQFNFFRNIPNHHGSKKTPSLFSLSRIQPLNTHSYSLQWQMRGGGIHPCILRPLQRGFSPNQIKRNPNVYLQCEKYRAPGQNQIPNINFIFFPTFFFFYRRLIPKKLLFKPLSRRGLYSFL